MKYILTPDEVRFADSTAINDFSIPSIVLMENAARSSAEYIKEIFDDLEILDPEIIILCGSGNNGGDGFAIARHLCENYSLKIFFIGNIDKMSPETSSNYQSATRIGIPILHLNNEEDVLTTDFNCDCLIDAMIGVGGSENIKGPALNILKSISDSNALKIAIDIPTGLNAETGIAHQDCFRADYTITMFASKTGMLSNDGIEVCGIIKTAYLGAPEFIVEGISNIHCIEEYDLTYLIPERKKKSTKFDYGRVMIIAGSQKYPGAATLCANAAIMSGAGFVFLYSTNIHSSLLPEVIPGILPTTSDGYISFQALDFLLEEAEKADSIVIGLGLGDCEETIHLVKELIEKASSQIPILIDADALRALDSNSKLRKNIVITPHCGEFARLTDIERDKIETSSNNYAVEWSKRLNCTILLKNSPSVITDGEISYWNIYGNPGMATGGSGDVLSGIIGALLARYDDPVMATALGAYIHTKAGDIYQNYYNQESLTASGLIEYLREAFITI